MPKLKKQVLRLMSNEIKTAQEMLRLPNRKNAEQRVATFLVSLIRRYHTRGLSVTEFRLTVETISRLLNHFHKSGLIKVDGKLITIVGIVNLGHTAAV